MHTLLTFDLDNTLWDVEPVVAKADALMHRFLQEACPAWQQLDTEALLQHRAAVWAAFPEQRHNLTFLRIALLERALQAVNLSAASARELAQTAFTVFHAARNDVVLYPHAHTVLIELATRHPLIALSNGNADIRQMAIGSLFSAHFSAESVGAAKPDRRMFDAALAHAGLSAGRTIHIGDHPEQDVAAAQALGMRSIWVNMDGQAAWPLDRAPDAEIRCLSELPSAVEKLLLAEA